MNSTKSEDRPTRRSKCLVSILGILIGAWIGFEALKQVVVIERSREPVWNTFDSMMDTCEYDIKRKIKWIGSDPPREFVFWTTRVTGSASLFDIPEE